MKKYMKKKKKKKYNLFYNNKMDITRITTFLNKFK